MPTKRKTALSIVCFYVLFLITSCVNPKKNIITFQNQNHENQAKVSVLNRSETMVRIQLTCVSKAKDIDFKNLDLVCSNINGMGVNTMESSDDNGLVQVYDGSYKGNKIRLILPYGNLEKNNPQLVLRIVTANNASLEMKLPKVKESKQEA